MNKSEAIVVFKLSKNNQKILAKKNPAEIRQAWNEALDYWQKSGHITPSQAFRWVNPFLSKKDR